MRLIGFVNGVEIAFDFYPPNTFIANIPTCLNGSYIVQLKAIDGAGNEGYFTDVLVYIDFQKMTFKLLNNNFKHMQNRQQYEYEIIKHNYSFRELVM